MTMNKIRRSGEGSNMLILSTIGRKSGELRQTPVRWFPGGEGSWLIVASANGAAGNPAWYFNLAAQPEVTIEVQGRTVQVIATQLAGAERAAAWARITAASPQFAGYERKTDREMPVLRLTPREPGAA
jgi:deazaflavin-dependent oxidoreductase (nitroreductase family)